jgi:hypothetical protein
MEAPFSGEELLGLYPTSDRGVSTTAAGEIPAHVNAFRFKLTQKYNYLETEKA